MTDIIKEKYNVRANMYYCDLHDADTPDGFVKVELINTENEIKTIYFEDGNLAKNYLASLNFGKFVETCLIENNKKIIDLDIGNETIYITYVGNCEYNCTKKVFIHNDNKNRDTAKNNKKIFETIKNNKIVFPEFSF